jgi:protein-disulfide isomerase
VTQNRPKIVDPREAERRRSLMFKIGAAVVLVAIAAGIAIWAVVSNQEDDNVTASGTPTVVTKDGALRITGAPAGTAPKAVLTVVEDFQCPACGSFESSFGPTLKELAKNPNVAIDYKPIIFLDQGRTSYSANTSNASMCVAQSSATNGDMTVWKKFHDLLFENQMAEGGAGPSNDQLKGWAKDAGAAGAGQCIDDDRFGAWLKARSSEVLNDPGFKGTPWLRLNGTTVELSTPDALSAAVLAAAK